MIDDIEALEKELADAIFNTGKWQSLADILTKQIEVAKERAEWSAKYPPTGVLSLPEADARRAVGGRPKKGEKSRTYLVERILRENRHSMHCTELLDKLNEQGYQFARGKRDPKVQLTQSLSKAKAFQNVGSNTWWLADMPVPNNGLPVNGHLPIEDVI